MANEAFLSFRTSFFLLSSLSLIPCLLCLSFDYTRVGEGLFPSELFYYGDVSVQVDSVQITKDDQSTQAKVGRLFYSDSVALWSASTGQEASFSTHFQFCMTSINASLYGDGVTFFLVGANSGNIPVNSTGQWLGLVSPANNGNASNEIVAVEFDTYQNPDISDPNSNHIGLDVNSVISETYDSGLGFDLKSSIAVYTWIDYDSSSHSLAVYATNNSTSKPDVPLLSSSIDLSQYLPSSVLVGFSASTEESYEVHYLSNWRFDCTDIDTGYGNNSNELIIGLVIGLSSLLAMIILGVLLVWRKRKRRVEGERVSFDEIGLPSWTSGPKKLTYRQLDAATRNFDSTRQLGQGGFGSVYRGTLSEDGSEVAVKRISQTSKQGAKEFRAEVIIISRIRHRNLVELKGWCHEKGDLLLAYEYLPNGSLDHHLFDKKREVLDWNTRYRIVCELGSALLYLHEECEQAIIHRDVKASNVMLDARFNAKLGDFGLARQLGEGAFAHTTLAAGTIGYMAPECYGTGQATKESDVYSYGAVLLEVTCGRRPNDASLPMEFGGLLVKWVWNLYGKGQVVEAVDVQLDGKFEEEEVRRTLTLGLACSHPDAKARPTMREALEVLHRRMQLPLIPASKPEVYYGPPPVALADLFTHTSSAPATSNSTATSSAPSTSNSTGTSFIHESPDRPFLHTLHGPLECPRLPDSVKQLSYTSIR